MNQQQLIGLCSIIICSLIHSKIGSQNVECSNMAYYVSANTDDKSTDFYRIMLPQGDENPRIELIKSNIPRLITAIGYRFEDQRIYGLDADTYELLQIDVFGNVRSLGIPESLNTELIYTAGALSPFDRHLVVVGKNKDTQTDELIHTIQLYNNRFYAGFISVVNDFNSSIDDFAVDPIRGLTYGFDRTSRRLVNVGLLDGFMTNFFAQTMSNVGAINSIFFDQEGQLYGIGGGSPNSNNQLFRINKLNGFVEPVDMNNMPSGNLSDACSCPYKLEIIQTSDATILAPCQEFEICYQLVNHTGGTRSYTSFRDTLPSDFEILEVLEKPFSGTVAGVGTNIFALENTDLLLDTNKILLRVRVSDFALGQYRSAPELEGNFKNLPINKTQSTWEVKTDELIVLNNGIESDCETGELLLNTALTSGRFLWNTGDTSSQIRISEAAWYSVTASLDCITTVDSIKVTAFPKAFEIEVIFPENAVAGQAIPLDIQSDTELINYSWRSNPPSRMSCTDCSNPLAFPIEDTYFEVVATDVFGCTASYSFELKVLIQQDIYAATAFSPNGDGINDFFYLQTLEGSAEVQELQIFNRWGNLVFIQKNVAINERTSAWDGTFRGKQATRGIYFWKATVLLVNGNTKSMAGTLQLMR